MKIEHSHSTNLQFVRLGLSAASRLVTVFDNLLQPQNLLFLGVEDGKKLRVEFVFKLVFFFLEYIKRLLVPLDDCLQMFDFVLELGIFFLDILHLFLHLVLLLLLLLSLGNLGEVDLLTGGKVLQEVQG